MTNENILLSGLMILMAASAFAYVDTQQKLEQAVLGAQYRLDHAAFAGKPVTADLRRAEAREHLANAKAELESFKTEGPAAYQRARLEKAVKVAQTMLERASFDGKPVTWDLRRAEARKRLAKDQSALEAFTAGGPAAFARAALEKAVQIDQRVIATGGGESKVIQREARIKAARVRLSQHEAALAGLNR